MKLLNTRLSQQLVGRKVGTGKGRVLMEGKVPMRSPAKEPFIAGELMQQYFGMQEPMARARIVRWWYRLTADVKGSSFSKGNSFSQNVLLWREQLASVLIFFFLLVLLALVLPLSIFTINLPTMVVASLLVCSALIAIGFNRAGKPHLAGLLIAASLNMGICCLILTGSGGLGIDTLALCDLLVISELFVASLLPIKWVILVVFLNSSFVVAALLALPKTPALAHAMQASAYMLLLRPLALYFIVATVLWLWVSSTMRTLKRVEQAELLATHEYMIAWQKYLLDASIEQVMQTLVQVANGNLKARVPLKEGTLLWPLTIALNHLLSRVQRLQHIEQEFLQLLPGIQQGKLAQYELQRAQEEIRLLRLIIQDARQNNRCMRTLRGGTLLDPLMQELNGQYLSPLPPYIRNVRDSATHPLSFVGDDDAPFILPDSDGGAL
jgi:hypothetical protein